MHVHHLVTVLARTLYWFGLAYMARITSMIAHSYQLKA